MAVGSLQQLTETTLEMRILNIKLDFFYLAHFFIYLPGFVFD